MCVEAGAAFSLSSDAHVPADVGHAYEDAVAAMRTWGIERIAVFERRERRLEPLG
jgi:histidinol-phosphatase (PHP family)